MKKKVVFYLSSLLCFRALFSFRFSALGADILFDKFWFVRLDLSDLAMCVAVMR
jgi:hypothetical protein